MTFIADQSVDDATDGSTLFKIMIVAPALFGQQSGATPKKPSVPSSVPSTYEFDVQTTHLFSFFVELRLRRIGDANRCTKYALQVLPVRICITSTVH